ncbi:MAG TPA: hypothetical protein VF491_11950, partial [Vicinamibacterales bacterium]
MTPWMWAVTIGIAAGFAYTLSPLTIIAIGLLIPLWKLGVGGLNERERRWFTAIFMVAIVTRLATIGILFLSADSSIPYANFFGDEEFFKRRTTWLLNLGLGVPISPADYFYAFDQTGETSYLQWLTLVQALVGLAPYGVHVLNALLYVAASIILFRLVRPAMGALAGLGGLLILLFLPSLFIWSISALKEPLYFFVVAIDLVAAAAVLRAGRWWQRLVAIAAVAACGYLLQSIREGGLAIAGASLVVGAVLAFLARRPRLLIAAAIALPLVGAVAITRPLIQDRALSVVHEAAYKHWGHVHKPGWVYKILDDRLYPDRNLIATMTAGEAGRFVVRAVYSYVTVPLPWQIESPRALVFLPEQMIWYVLIALVPIGAIFGIRRDPELVSLLIAHGAAVSMLVAMSGGNVGTLIRHRGLAMPYFAWLAALG